MLLMGENDENKAKAFMEQAKKRRGDDDNESDDDNDDKTSKQDKVEAPSATSSKSGNADNVDDDDPVEVKALQLAAKIAAKHQHQVPSSDEKAIKQALEYKTRGNQYYAKKEWTKAAELYTQAIEMDPTNAIFYSNRSACYMALSKDATAGTTTNTNNATTTTTASIDFIHKALADAVVARQLRPDWPKACYRMAVARLACGRYEDAAVAAWEGLAVITAQQQDNDDNNSNNKEELQSLLQKCVKKGRQEHLLNATTIVDGGASASTSSVPDVKDVKEE
jgi:tetratricopeptide (TPR) repeat protein